LQNYQDARDDSQGLGQQLDENTKELESLLSGKIIRYRIRNALSESDPLVGERLQTLYQDIKTLHEVSELPLEHMGGVVSNELQEQIENRNRPLW
jgi:hypothetical protein